MKTKFDNFDELVSNYLIGQRVLINVTPFGDPIFKTVQGYLFDGYWWHPAYDDWDGWQPLFEEEE